MKNKALLKGWENLIGENLPKIKLTSSDVTWVFELLGGRMVESIEIGRFGLELE